MELTADQIQQLAGRMLSELQEYRLEVMLVPSCVDPDSSGKRRLASNINPWWYQELCAEYPSYNCRRKGKKHMQVNHDPVIKRHFVISCLKRLASGKIMRRKSCYKERLLWVMAKILKKQEEEAEEFGPLIIDGPAMTHEERAGYFRENFVPIPEEDCTDLPLPDDLF